MALVLDSLEKALLSYERALKVIEQKKEDESISEDEWYLLKAGLIQNFEFSYELCWKFMKRWLEENISPEIVSGVPRIELYRVAAANGLIDDPNHWMLFHKARNQTSHIYDQTISDDVFDIAMTFLTFANQFHTLLELKNV